MCVCVCALHAEQTHWGESHTQPFGVVKALRFAVDLHCSRGNVLIRLVGVSSGEEPRLRVSASAEGDT